MALRGADGCGLTESELRREILKLQRRVEKLAALLRFVLALLHASGFTLSRERLPDGRAKRRMLCALAQARACIPLRALLQFAGLSPSRFHAWRRRQTACALDDQSSCPRTVPHQLTAVQVRAIAAMVIAPEYRHVPTGTLAVLAQRVGTVWASPGQTPDEVYFGTGDAVPADLRSRAAAARRARVEANRAVFCETCPSLNAAA